ncbi:MAG: transcription antitermination factor NusB [Alphaproteobacteria bacterium]
MTKSDARRTARLAAVQAIYQHHATDGDPSEIFEQFLAGRLGELLDDEALPTKPKKSLFSKVFHGVMAEQENLQEIIAANLSEGWALERLEPVIRAILCAGVYELTSVEETPAKVVISEYIEIAHGFFDGDEPKFINSILDKVARALGRLD